MLVSPRHTVDDPMWRFLLSCANTFAFSSWMLNEVALVCYLFVAGCGFQPVMLESGLFIIAYYYHWCKERTDTRRSQSCNCSQCTQVDTGSCNYLPYQYKYLKNINEKSTNTWEAFSQKWSLKNTRKSFVIVFGSYSNFNWIIKALIGAKFNINFRFNDAF